MVERKPYKLPTLCRGKEWFVHFYYEWPDKPGHFKEFKVKDGINRISDLKQREAYGQKLIENITYFLENKGYNPFEEEDDIIIKAKKVVEKFNSLCEWTLRKAINEYSNFIDGKGYTDNTKRTYRKYVKAFETWLEENEYLDQVAATFTEMDVQVFLEDLYESENWSGRTFNNYLHFMVTFFNKSIKLEKKETRNRSLQYDFIPDDLEEKITTPQRNKAFTPMMLHQLKQELKGDKDRDLKEYLEWIFMSCMRPDEVRRLKVEHIDDVSRQIRMIGKEGDRLVPISDQMMRFLNRRKVFSAGLSSYIFGYAGDVDERRMGAKYMNIKFRPVAKKLKLDENYGPYSMKPTGVIAMINAGFEDEECMVMTGHKTIEAFRAYKRDLIIDNSHVMKGSVVEF